VEVPLRNALRDQQTPTGPSPAKLAADALAAEQKRRARQLQEDLVKAEAKKQKEAFAARIKKEKEQREKLMAQKKMSDGAAERARVKATAEHKEHRAKFLQEEREARERLQKVLDAEELTPRGSRMSEEEIRAAAKRMRERWSQKATPPPARAPTDPYAPWRGSSSASTGRRAMAEEEEEEEKLAEGATEEEAEQFRARQVKAKERDVAARRILAYSSKTLTDALGLPHDATDTEVDSTVRKVLRLLHPDYSINLSIKGTRRHMRIEAAFKRLNGLRDE